MSDEPGKNGLFARICEAKIIVDKYRSGTYIMEVG